MVSHIDADHITGILDLFKALEQRQEDGEDGFCRIQTLWHNSFEKLHGGKAGGRAIGDRRRLARRRRAAARPRMVHRGGRRERAAGQPAAQAGRCSSRFRSIRARAAISVAAPARGQQIVTIADGLTFTVLAPNDGAAQATRGRVRKAAKAVNTAPTMPRSAPTI